MGKASTKAQPFKKRYFDFKEACDDSGMTYAEIGARLGKKHRSYVSNVCARRFRPSLEMMAKIEKLLNVDMRAYL